MNAETAYKINVALKRVCANCGETWAQHRMATDNCPLPVQEDGTVPGFEKEKFFKEQSDEQVRTTLKG